MTLASLYYDLNSHKIIIKLANEPQTEFAKKTIIYLANNIPQIYYKWEILKNKTNIHLQKVYHMINNYIMIPIDRIIKKISKEFPTFKEYKSNEQNQDSFVIDNIREGIFLEIQHYAALGNKLNYFSVDETNGKIGNGYLFVKSTNLNLLHNFSNEINTIITNSKTIKEFNMAEIQKTEIETEIFEFRKDLLRYIV